MCMYVSWGFTVPGKPPVGVPSPAWGLPREESAPIKQDRIETSKKSRFVEIPRIGFLFVAVQKAAHPQMNDHQNDYNCCWC